MDNIGSTQFTLQEFDHCLVLLLCSYSIDALTVHTYLHIHVFVYMCLCHHAHIMAVIAYKGYVHIVYFIKMTPFNNITLHGYGDVVE